MKKSKLTEMLILSAGLALTGCNLGESSSMTSEENKDPYFFYKIDNSQVEEKSGKTVYFSSDSYTSKRQQGYNHFFYKIFDGTSTTEIPLTNNEFFVDGVGFKDALMTSKGTKSVIRSFVSPVAGEAIIRNTVKLIEGTSGSILVSINGTSAVTQNVNSESTYFELKKTLKVGDIVNFELIGDLTVSYNPEIDFTGDYEPLLHTACDGFYGDVHPYYDEATEKLYMFYLSTGQQSHDATSTFQSMLTTSEDFFHFKDEICKINDRKRPEQDLYFVLNVFKDKEGNYRSSQGGNLKTCSSISSDLHTWETGSKPVMDGEGNLTWSHQAGFATGVYSGRDPDTFYDQATDKYYTVVINYYSNRGDKGDKYLNLYIADNQGNYSSETTKLINFTGRGDPECPQIKRIGKRWYLIYSVYGSGARGNVGKITYRVGPENVLPENVNWDSMPEYSLDGADLHAAQIFNIKDKMYFYGWIHYEYNAAVWGGYLNLPHEVFVKSDGTLGTRLDPKLLEYLDKGTLFSSSTPLTRDTGFATVNRNLIQATISEGATLTMGRTNIGIKTSMNKKYIYIDNGSYSNELQVEASNDYSLTIVKDNKFLEISVNDEAVMTCHTDLLTDCVFSGNPGTGSISNVKISKLANLNNVTK